MRESLTKKLRCPIDLGELLLDVFNREADGHIMTGELECMTCRRTYVIEQGVPDFVDAEREVDGKNFGRLQDAIVERFGFEWRYFRDWGWLSEYPNVRNAEEKFYGSLIEHTQQAFWSKSLFGEHDLHPGLLVLDAGCGNGRFTHQAAQTGAEVVGVDLSWSVYSAFEHMRSLSNVHIVRGDLFRLPFTESMFDRIFSIGVLHHTGNAGVAFDALIRTLRPGGQVVAHVYGRGRRTYEILDSLIRTLTTRLPIKMQIGFARLAAATARWLRGGKWHMRFYRRLFSHINLLPTEHHMYDWWSAPVATHHTQDEVLGWFSRNELEIVRTNPSLNDVAAEEARRLAHGAVTVLGRRPVAD
jgi:SAM-dependent methyltransferase/uncharacterized protein YbaR (Trm112 family)